MTRPYIPKGKVLKLLSAMELRPGHAWTIAEAAEVMGLVESEVRTYVAVAVAREALFKGRKGGWVVLSLTPLVPVPVVAQPTRRGWHPEEDLRVPRVVPGWVPPQMVAPREVRA